MALSWSWIRKSRRLWSAATSSTGASHSATSASGGTLAAAHAFMLETAVVNRKSSKNSNLEVSSVGVYVANRAHSQTNQRGGDARISVNSYVARVLRSCYVS